MLLAAPTQVPALATLWHLGRSSGGFPVYQAKLSLRTHTKTDAIYSPSGLKFELGYHVRTSKDSRASGAPKQVLFFKGTYDKVDADFPDRETEIQVRGPKKGRYLARLLDESGSPTATTPHFAELVEPNGDRYRFALRALPGIPVGALVECQPKGKPTQTLADSGFEIMLDEAGTIQQVRGHARFINVITLNDHKYRVDFFKTEQIPSKKVDGLYPVPEDLTPEYFYTLENPDPDTREHFKKIDYKNGNILRIYEWTHNTRLDDYNLARLDRNGKHIRWINRRWLSEDESLFWRQRSRHPCGGIITTTSASKMLGGTRKTVHLYKSSPRQHTITHFTYYEDPSIPGSFGRLKQKVIEHGDWELHVYDEQGRLRQSWTPEKTDDTEKVTLEYPEKPGEPAPPAENEEELDELLGAFTGRQVPPGMKLVTQTMPVFLPAEPPADPSKADQPGIAVFYDYEPLLPEDTVASDDSRPRTVTHYRHGKFKRREWFVYTNDDPAARPAIQQNTTRATDTFTDLWNPADDPSE